jgi:hypothetical protein
MPHLLRRYSFADFRKALRKRVNSAALSTGDFARWIDGLAQDFVLMRTTQFTWGQARLARELSINLTLARSATELRTIVLGRLSSIPFKNSWSLNQRAAKHFPPKSDRS